MNCSYQDTKKAQILKPLEESQIESYLRSFQYGEDDGKWPVMVWVDPNYPSVHRKLTRLFRKEYGGAASSVADAYICGFVRGIRAGVWDSFKPQKKTPRKH